MRALWLQDGQLKLADLPVPAPGPGEALLRVHVAGLCNTDLELRKGYAGFAGVPGHEFVAEVVSAPAATEWVGRRVVGEINVSCGRCRECASGLRGHCAERTVVGIRGRQGALAEYLTLPIANLHELPAALPDHVAVFTEPAAAALEVQEQVAIGPGRRVVVVGDGKLGQLLARTLLLTGAELRVIGRHADKLGRLARRGIPVGEAGSVPERWADVAVECTGKPEGFETARRVVRPRGTLVLKSTYHGPAPIDLSAVVVDELTLVGSRCGPFAKALALLGDGRLEVSDLVADVYRLDQASEAFDAASRPGALKVLVNVAAA
jgi:threonine dehydrogenase-like Zn-dependent dehydrogenase